MYEGDVSEPAPRRTKRSAATRAWRLLAWGVLPLAVSGLVACSSSDETEQGTTTETGSGKQFCVAAAELASAIQTESWQPGMAIERAFPRSLEGLDDLANSAPEAIGRAAENLRSGLERFYSTLDEVPAVGDPPDPALVQQAQETMQRAGQAQAEAAPALQEVGGFVQQNCPGTTLPAVTVPTTGVPPTTTPAPPSG